MSFPRRILLFEEVAIEVPFSEFVAPQRLNFSQEEASMCKAHLKDSEKYRGPLLMFWCPSSPEAYFLCKLQTLGSMPCRTNFRAFTFLLQSLMLAVPCLLTTRLAKPNIILTLPRAPPLPFVPLQPSLPDATNCRSHCSKRSKLSCYAIERFFSFQI